MKKTYLKPTSTVVKLQQTGIICTSDVRSVNSNADIDYGGGGSGSGRVKGISDYNVWDEEW
ncbi:MAG: hypothetical protein J6W03_10055 [Bacteroidaceae bacterium]|nr:hypothetical protein [Bacteroidaceae bacterium]